ncbi:hypothetical protein IGB42_01791 [Andreprevotia sp. IGB-42]|uniref:DUF433 domain-containing protein n=1 Tax=Andreprevotia sp. IGB-42 TaxID=2497473 RepID=UPI0013578C11|nr:DUF433 domain-containing protein [Andreprevotia sp. IGB-42]KAF0813440.1 hypothetical protein IGB42_01791 [Andreprevotia sp. IGB-42]
MHTDKFHLYLVNDPASGATCFVGTHVPVADVLSASAAGASLEALQAVHPFLSAELLAIADAYMRLPESARQLHPLADAAPAHG